MNPSGVCHVDGQSEKDRPNIKQNLIHSYNTILGPKVTAACMDSTNVPSRNTHPLRSNSSKEFRRNDRVSFFDWFYQFRILLQRSLKERKHESFNTLRVCQVIAAALLAGLMWWHSDYRNIQDRLGLLFFISIFWGVFPSFNSVFAFPQERTIFMKGFVLVIYIKERDQPHWRHLCYHILLASSTFKHCHLSFLELEKIHLLLIVT